MVTISMKNLEGIWVKLNAEQVKNKSHFKVSVLKFIQMLYKYLVFKVEFALPSDLFLI